MEEEYIDTRNTVREYQRALANLLQNREVSEANQQIVQRFVREASIGKTIVGRAKKKVKPVTLHKYIVHLNVLLRFTKLDLDKMTESEMERFVEALENDQIRCRTSYRLGRIDEWQGEPLSQAYKVAVKKTIKKFYKWLWGDARTFPRLVEWMDTHEETKEIQALSEAEVQRLIDFARTVREKAIIQVLFDGGLRIAELLNVRLRHLRHWRLDDGNVEAACFMIRVPFSKTLPRTVALPMPETTKWLGLWLEQHPAKPTISEDGSISAIDTAAQLFPTTDNAVRLVLRRIGDEALGKRIYPHLLRHTSATYWSNRLSHFKLCKRFGWTMTSQMPQRYIDRQGVDELEMAKEYHRVRSKVESAEQTLT